MNRALTVSMCFLAVSASAQDCRPYVEEHASGTSVSVRPHATSLQRCTLDELAYRRVLGEWLRSRAPSLPAVTSISLGRAVDHPWIADWLSGVAMRDAAWATKAARARGAQRDRLVAEILNDPVMLQRLAVPFERSRYRVVGVTYEKVLWKAGAPIDAQVWLRIAPL